MDTSIAPPRVVQTSASSFRWTRQRYDQLIAAGILNEDEKVELLDGEIVAMSPQGSYHATLLVLMTEALRAVYGKAVHVRSQLPMALDPDAEPEPDIAVVEGRPRDFLKGHPTSAKLVVEVADTTLPLDRTRKARLYARQGIAEYWILNVEEETLEVYREPSGDTYQTKITLRRGDSITPPGGTGSIDLVDVLP